MPAVPWATVTHRGRAERPLSGHSLWCREYAVPAVALRTSGFRNVGFCGDASTVHCNSLTTPPPVQTTSHTQHGASLGMCPLRFCEKASRIYAAWLTPRRRVTFGRTSTLAC
eukprot:2341956-Pyramimonas_sp.AAC.1